jgi:hypothetical protein
MTDFTETEITLAMEAHECTREEAVSTYAASVRAYREAQRPVLQLEALRAARDEKLKFTDWWVLPDRTATQAQLDYRQALRDITNTYSSLGDVVWPDQPA